MLTITTSPMAISRLGISFYSSCLERVVRMDSQGALALWDLWVTALAGFLLYHCGGRERYSLTKSP